MLQDDAQPDYKETEGFGGDEKIKTRGRMWEKSFFFLVFWFFFDVMCLYWPVKAPRGRDSNQRGRH